MSDLKLYLCKLEGCATCQYRKQFLIDEYTPKNKYLTICIHPNGFSEYNGKAIYPKCPYREGKNYKAVEL